MIAVIEPAWPAPANVRALMTTRVGGVSTGAYASLNLAAHVGDYAEAVRTNRQLLAAALALPADPSWLAQEHGSRVIDATHDALPAAADGAVTRQRNTVCAVLTADCLPILLCDVDGTCVAAVHAGWRGLLNGVIDAGVTALGADPARLLAWIGPAIGAASYEVGADLRDRFTAADPAHAAYFSRAGSHWMFDLHACCAGNLIARGVRNIYHSDRCTQTERDTFFSHRRDGVTGRMASLIWRCG